MVAVLIWLIVLAIVIALAYWIIDAVPIPDPLNRWLKIAIVVIGAIALIMVLLNVAGVSTGLPPALR